MLWRITTFESHRRYDIHYTGASSHSTTKTTKTPESVTEEAAAGHAHSPEGSASFIYSSSSNGALSDPEHVDICRVRTGLVRDL